MHLRCFIEPAFTMNARKYIPVPRTISHRTNPPGVIDNLPKSTQAVACTGTTISVRNLPLHCQNTTSSVRTMHEYGYVYGCHWNTFLKIRLLLRVSLHLRSKCALQDR